MLCIFFIILGINNISDILTANLALPFDGNAVLMTEVSEFEDGLQANKSVFPLRCSVMLCPLKYFIALNSSTDQKSWVAARIARPGAGRHIPYEWWEE